MNLNDRLLKIRSEFETGDTPGEIIEVFDRHIEQLIASELHLQAIKVGERAPLEMEAASASGNVPLKAFMGKHFLVLTWFRGNW